MRENIERLIRKKKRIRIFFSSGFCFSIEMPGKGSKYREFYDLSGRITCMVKRILANEFKSSRKKSEIKHSQNKDHLQYHRVIVK